MELPAAMCLEPVGFAPATLRAPHNPLPGERNLAMS